MTISPECVTVNRQLSQRAGRRVLSACVLSVSLLADDYQLLLFTDVDVPLYRAFPHLKDVSSVFFEE